MQLALTQYNAGFVWRRRVRGAGQRVYTKAVIRGGSIVKKSTSSKDREVAFRRRSSVHMFADLIADGADAVHFGKDNLEGGITKPNFLQFFRKKGMDDADLDKLFEKVDANGDGKVYEAEFQA
jgi:hypothetical protein